MLLELTICLLLTAHLLCVNVCSVGPLVCVWAHWRRSPVLTDRSRFAPQVALLCVVLLFLGAGLGFAVGWLDYLRGDSRLLQVLPRFTWKIWWGIAELLCYVVWMGAYWMWLKLAPPRRVWLQWLQSMLPILASTNLLYHFPTLLTVMAKSARGELTLESTAVSAAQFRPLAFSPGVIAHALHFTMASAAVCGVLMMLLAARGEDRTLRIAGARLGLASTLAQIPIGVWLLVSMPATTQTRITGGEAVGTILLLLSILAAFSLMQNLAAAALSESAETEARWAIVLLLATVLLMTATLRRARAPATPVVQSHPIPRLSDPVGADDFTCASGFNRCQIPEVALSYRWSG